MKKNTNPPFPLTQNRAPTLTPDLTVKGVQPEVGSTLKK